MPGIASSLNPLVLDEVGPVDTEVYRSPWQLTRSDRLSWVGHREAIWVIYRAKVSRPLVFWKEKKGNNKHENPQKTLISFFLRIR